MMLAEESAREVGDQNEARSHRETIGAALLLQGQLREALAYCEESVEAAEARRDAVGVATALANCASIRNSMGQYEIALELAQQAETALGDAEARDILLGAIGQQAVAFEGLGRISEAEERYEARREVAWREGELSYYARALRGLAKIKRERPEDRAEARALYDKAAQMFSDLKDNHGYRDTLNGLGVLELKAGALGTAEELYRRVLSSAVEDDHKGDQARAKMNLGIVNQERGTEQGYKAADAEYGEALALASASDETSLPGDVLYDLAQHHYYRVGDYRHAREEAASAAEAYRLAGSTEKDSCARQLMDEIDRANASVGSLVGGDEAQIRSDRRPWWRTFFRGGE
jgi:tetratricopeptide (TPR) repeat protein